MTTLAPEKSSDVFEINGQPETAIAGTTPLPSPELTQETPYYALNEDQIRVKVTQALAEAEKRKAVSLAEGKGKVIPIIIGLSEDSFLRLDAEENKGQIQDIDKARIMAEAERPYRDRAARKHRQVQRIVETLKDPESWWSVVREPVKVARAVSKEIEKNILLTRAYNAATLAYYMNCLPVH